MIDERPWPEVCTSCGIETKWKYISVPVVGDIVKLCRNCYDGKEAHVSDVYFDGKPEINLADGPDGKPRTFSCKSEKAAYLKSKGLQEAGDKVHGGFQSFSSPDQHKRVNSRDEVQKALQKVRQMGKDVRRQEYLRIMKEAQRA